MYFGLYVVFTQMLGTIIVIPGDWEMPEIETLPPFRNVISWTALHVFGVTRPLVITGSGSGDKTFDWVAAFCLLVAAILAMALWSVIDRKRENYVTAHKWFRVFLRARRILLAGQLVFGAYIFAVFLQSSRHSWTSYGAGAPRW